MKFYAISTALVLLGCAIISTHATTTTVYKSVGKRGEVRYSQLQPKNVKFETIQMRSDGRTASAGQMAQLPDPATAPTSQSAESQRIAELEKQVQEQKAAEMARHCQNMRANLANLNTGGRIYETNEQGQRVYLNDQEISAKKQKTLDTINQHCK